MYLIKHSSMQDSCISFWLQVDVRGYCCKTNVQSNTAFRGFGGPQGLLVTENFMDEIACELDMDQIDVREKNLYVSGNRTFYTQKLEHCTLLRCWQECKEQSQFYAERYTYYLLIRGTIMRGVKADSCILQIWRFTSFFKTLT